MRVAKAVLVTMLLGASMSAGEIPGASITPANPDVKTLMQRALAEEFTPDREVLVDMVVIPPNSELERHWHPGEEFHYYLEGEVEVRIDGEPPIIGTPGTVGHVPYKKLHTAVTGEKGARILVFRVHTRGEPWRYLEKEAAAAAR